MNKNIDIVSNAINYTLNNDQIRLNPIINDEITLTDYQFTTARYFILNNNLKSLLALYETGKGKTLLALYIVNNLFKVYDDWKIILLCKASLIKTPWESSIDSLYPDLKSKIKIFSIEETNLALKLSSFISSSARTLVIIDEIHIFISRCISKDIGDKRILLKTYKKIKDILSKSFTNKLLMLSATPIVNSADEFVYLYNLLNPYFLTPSIKLVEKDNLFYEDELIKGLLGKVSYVKSSEAASFENSEPTDRMVGKRISYLNFNPTKYQKEIYMKVDKKEKALASRGFRIKRNLACQFVYDGMDTNTEFKVETWLPADEDELKRRSIKFFECCKLINKAKGKVLIFEAFIEYGVNILKKYLDFYKISYGTFTGNDSNRYKSLEEFQRIENKDGDEIKVFILSSAAKEGISFSYITNVIILSSSWNEASLSQIIGRSIRLDSHKGSNIEYVNIYFLQLKIEDVKSKTFQTADEEIFEIMLNKFKVFNKMYRVFKESSIENVIEKNNSKELSIAEFKSLYFERINENNRITEKFIEEKNAELLYYSYDKIAKRFYLGYLIDDIVYDENGVKAGKIIKPVVYKIVNSKLIVLIERI